MKRFLIRGFLYSIPLIIILASIAIVDPYYLFHKDRPFDDEKFEIGYSFDQGRRYKIFTYWNNPTDKIIVGASEINIINERNIPESGWHSLSYGGAPLQESLRMYWEVSKIHHIKEIIIAPEFIKYYNAISSGNGDPYYANFNWQSSQSAKALSIYENKSDYFTDRYTLKSTFHYLSSFLFSQSDQSKPQMEKEQFWKSQMDYAHEVYDHNTVFPSKIEEVKKLFVEIANDARKKGVKVHIVIPAQHTELLKLEMDKKCFPIYKDYMSFLTKLFGQVDYFGYTEGVSNDPKQFSDPFHCKNADIYINGLFKDGKVLILTPKKVNNQIDSIRKKVYE